jgi:hypothetical protein
MADMERLVTKAVELTFKAPRYAVKVSPIWMTPKLSGRINAEDRSGAV